MNQKELRELFDYDEKTGDLIWKKKTSSHSRVTIGSVAGTLHHDGYITIIINRKQYQAHRLVWIYCNGDVLTKDIHIDHINHKRNDNSISNLRTVSNRDNAKNRKVSKVNTSGVLGVNYSKRDKHWVVRINTDDERKFIGTFKNFDEAVKARKEAEMKYGYHENHNKLEVA